MPTLAAAAALCAMTWALLPSLQSSVVAADLDPSAQLDEHEPAAPDDGLVRFAVDGFSVTLDDGISMAPLQSMRVRKIQFGRITEVEIRRTASGTYSSDAISSRHISYPGVHVTKVQTADRKSASGGVLATWHAGLGWVEVPLTATGSFAMLTRTSAGALLTTDRGSCVLTSTSAFC